MGQEGERRALNILAGRAKFERGVKKVGKETREGGQKGR